MNFGWQIANIDDEPDVELAAWSVFRVHVVDIRDVPTFHLAGHRRQNPFGKVSSAVTEFDPKRRRLRTESSEIYELCEEAGTSYGGERAKSLWLAKYKIVEFEDVTAKFVRLMEVSK